VAGDADEGRHLRAKLTGFQEVVPPTLGLGALFSTGSGRISLKIGERKREIHYTLSYAFPDAGATPPPPNSTQFVNQAHLHFGQKHTTGGINVWLCQSADSPAPAAVAAATPMCPSPSGTVAGTIRPAQVIALSGQAFPAGEDGGFDALLEAIRADAIYANVHTDKFPLGEIRGQLDHDSDHDD
jgi:CHRD domain